MKKLSSLVLAAMALAFIAVQTDAQLTAPLIQGFSGGNPVSVGPGTAGFGFQVGAQPITLVTVGIFDEFSDGVLNSSHQVGIWNSSGVLLESATVTPQNATLVNGFFFVNLAAPLTLAAGSNIRIGASYSNIDLDLARANVPAANVTVNSGITLNDAYLSTGTGFTFPDLNVSGANDGFFGPNAGFTAVPEPAATVIVTAAGLAVLAAIRRWKARHGAPEAATA